MVKDSKIAQTFCVETLLGVTLLRLTFNTMIWCFWPNLYIMVHQIKYRFEINYCRHLSMPSRKSEIKTMQRKKPIFSNLPYRVSHLYAISCFRYRSKCFMQRLFIQLNGNAHHRYVPLARLQLSRSELTDLFGWNLLVLMPIKQSVQSHVLLTILLHSTLHSKTPTAWD